VILWRIVPQSRPLFRHPRIDLLSLRKKAGHLTKPPSLSLSLSLSLYLTTHSQTHTYSSRAPRRDPTPSVRRLSRPTPTCIRVYLCARRAAKIRDCKRKEEEKIAASWTVKKLKPSGWFYFSLAVGETGKALRFKGKELEGKEEREREREREN
jgi:hypothetical protein